MTSFQEHLLKYDCHLLMEECSHDELRDLDKDLPSDTHLVMHRITTGLEQPLEFATAIRAFKMVDIFDALHDLGHEVTMISQGYGTIKPKLYGYQAPVEAKKS